MTTAVLSHSAPHAKASAATSQFDMIVFLASEAMLFAGLLGGYFRWLFATLVLGAIFVGFQSYEWWHLHHEGLWFQTGGIFGSSFFVITGFHGMHVLIGVLLILWVLLRQLLTRCHTPEHHISLSNIGLYWHFVDINPASKSGGPRKRLRQAHPSTGGLCLSEPGFRW